MKHHTVLPKEAYFCVVIREYKQVRCRCLNDKAATVRDVVVVVMGEQPTYHAGSELTLLVPLDFFLLKLIYWDIHCFDVPCRRKGKGAEMLHNYEKALLSDHEAFSDPDTCLKSGY
ncbi:hypothetical protein J6590_107598, partial [Homalodisca vitripennis]